MLNKLQEFIREYALICPGDQVVCAVSGGADSMALLWAMYLLRDKLQIRLAAAHFNHKLRGEESERDEAFVRKFCEDFQIPFYSASARVVPGKKGLEAAARDARYAFLETLPGKLATAHTANDNAETVLLHLVRGTGLKGLGAIAPVSGKKIRPMLGVTRKDVLAFLDTYHISFVTDSSNETDAFLRNRLRHHVMPLLEQENPRIAENLSAMALRLREDEKTLEQMAASFGDPGVEQLRQMPPGLRSRVLARFLESCGVREPEAEHIALAEKLVFSQNPSAGASLPGGVTICRNYNKLERCPEIAEIKPVALECPGVTLLPDLGLRVRCAPAEHPVNQAERFTVVPHGPIFLRARQPGDTIRLSGGSKSLKKLFIDRKIPASHRGSIPVIADDLGVLGIYGFGANLERQTGRSGVVEIYFETISQESKEKMEDFL